MGVGAGNDDIINVVQIVEFLAQAPKNLQIQRETIIELIQVKIFRRRKIKTKDRK